MGGIAPSELVVPANSGSTIAAYSLLRSASLNGSTRAITEHLNVRPHAPKTQDEPQREHNLSKYA